MTVPVFDAVDANTRVGHMNGNAPHAAAAAEEEEEEEEEVHNKSNGMLNMYVAR
jgi:hypothetical protein